MPGPIIGLVAIALVVFAAYSFLWFTVADQIKTEYPRVLADFVDSETPVAEPEVTGYPGNIKIYVAEENLATEEGRVKLENVRAQGWPIPMLPVDVTTDKITIRQFQMGTAAGV